VRSTITETCSCGATITTTSDPINTAMNVVHFRRAHEACRKPIASVEPWGCGGNPTKLCDHCTTPDLCREDNA